ncbi:hypothetical protein FNV43_RR05569 [Rhamnella rubrinervis]|uniref:Uncharacterized protein n=1 Tax=Rhamnella rubrinervis TaxID=2594499 RepID=A0A8K0MQJ9_9ROSA|nr:hypothetical protein FNV43_RR05569 [Rhamnella rubrinervis]
MFSLHSGEDRKKVWSRGTPNLKPGLLAYAWDIGGLSDDSKRVPPIAKPWKRVRMILKLLFKSEAQASSSVGYKSGQSWHAKILADLHSTRLNVSDTRVPTSVIVILGIVAMDWMRALILGKH